LGKEIFGKDQGEIKKEGFIIDPLLRQVNPKQVNLPKIHLKKMKDLSLGMNGAGLNWTKRSNNVRKEGWG
jgi:hypothetical protein